MNYAKTWKKAYKKGYNLRNLILQYALAKQSAVKNGIDFIALEEQVTKKQYRTTRTSYQIVFIVKYRIKIRVLNHV